MVAIKRARTARPAAAALRAGPCTGCRPPVVRASVSPATKANRVADRPITVITAIDGVPSLLRGSKTFAASIPRSATPRVTSTATILAFAGVAVGAGAVVKVSPWSCWGPRPARHVTLRRGYRELHERGDLYPASPSHQPALAGRAAGSASPGARDRPGDRAARSTAISAASSMSSGLPRVILMKPVTEAGSHACATAVAGAWRAAWQAT
jgi:hypothetical protein